MGDSRFDRLDDVVLRFCSGEHDAVGALSTGEKLYIALTANDTALLTSMNYTIPAALARLGPEWTATLIARWEYRGNPARQLST